MRKKKVTVNELSIELNRHKKSPKMILTTVLPKHE